MIHHDYTVDTGRLRSYKEWVYGLCITDFSPHRAGTLRTIMEEFFDAFYEAFGRSGNREQTEQIAYAMLLLMDKVVHCIHDFDFNEYGDYVISHICNCGGKGVNGFDEFYPLRLYLKNRVSGIPEDFMPEVTRIRNVIKEIKEGAVNG